MRMNRRQMQTLARYPRATRVWQRKGMRLARTTRVEVRGNCVRVIPKGAAQ